MSRPVAIALATLTVVLPFGLLAWLLLTDDDDEGDGIGGVTAVQEADADVEVGARLPDFVLEDLYGEPTRLSDFRGKPVVLTFFASWCNPCQEEMPVLQEAWEERLDEFTAVAVSYNDLARDTRVFVEELGVTYPVLLDVNDTVLDRYGLRGIPQTFFLDEDGVLLDKVYGITTREALDEPLDALLDGA